MNYEHWNYYLDHRRDSHRMLPDHASKSDPGICDIPRIFPDGDNIDTCSTSEVDAMKELTGNGEGTS